MTNELDIAFTAAYQDPEIRVIILRGEGKHFSSGHDLGTPEQNADTNWTALSSNGFRGEYEKWSTLDADYCLKWRSLGKPVICVLKGYCVYHACSLAAVADMVVAADDLRYMPTMVQAFFLPWDLALNARKVRRRSRRDDRGSVDSFLLIPSHRSLRSCR